MHIIYAEKHVSLRERPLTPEEAKVRRIAYAIKVGHEPEGLQTPNRFGVSHE